MSDFVQTMMDWRRMCRETMRCYKCPMYEKGELHTLCSEGGMASIENPDVAEQVVTKWAQEHPEPVYPTWADYITKFMIHDVYIGKLTDLQTVLEYALRSRIPADIAQKLGLQPKED